MTPIAMNSVNCWLGPKVLASAMLLSCRGLDADKHALLPGNGSHLLGRQLTT